MVFLVIILVVFAIGFFVYACKMEEQRDDLKTENEILTQGLEDKNTFIKKLQQNISKKDLEIKKFNEAGLRARCEGKVKSSVELRVENAYLKEKIKEQDHFLLCARMDYADLKKSFEQIKMATNGDQKLNNPS